MPEHSLDYERAIELTGSIDRQSQGSGAENLQGLNVITKKQCPHKGGLKGAAGGDYSLQNALYRMHFAKLSASLFGVGKNAFWATTM